MKEMNSIFIFEKSVVNYNTKSSPKSAFIKNIKQNILQKYTKNTTKK